MPEIPEPRSTSQPLVISALAEDRPDLLPQTVALLRRRSFQVRSLSIGPTDTPHVARVTVTLDGPQREAKRLVRELGRLLYVLSADDLSDVPRVGRQLALVKVTADAAMRPQVAQVCEVFRARIVDVAADTVIVEATGNVDKIDGLLAVLRPFGIVEMVRSEPVALARSGRHLAYSSPPSTWLEDRLRTDSKQAH
ncbi:MAG: acetolactate synthase small subunit [Thermoanaerobaculia bacterium]|nr:acetolactate synthase small subunit [Thermoanaerobaculia bacterium]